MGGLDHLSDRLQAMRSEGLWREPPAPSSEGDLELGTNDYLGIGAADASGALGSRLLAGDQPQHTELERALSTWVGTEAALTFTSGYAANVGTLSAIARAGDIVVSDALNHASLVDGCRLSRAEVRVVPHLDLDAVRTALRARPAKSAAYVVTESYFSMDADSPDLAELARICAEGDAALVVDEAHALGVFGPEGAGLCAATAVTPDVLVGTFGKALGVQGAFVAGAPILRQWLWNRARSFVFSTGLAPGVAAQVTANIARVRAADAKRARLAVLACQFRAGLADAGIQALGHGPIVPWVVGGPDRAMQLAAALRATGIRVHAVRPPTVPSHASRLRFALHAALTEADLARTLDSIRATL